MLQKGRKQHANVARGEDFVRQLGHIKRNGSVSSLNYTLPSPSHSRIELMIAAEGVKTRLQEMSIRRTKSEKTFWLPKELTSPHVEGETSEQQWRRNETHRHFQIEEPLGLD